MALKVHEDQRPSDYEYALMSSNAYSHFNAKANKDDFKKLEAKGWEILDKHSNEDSGYAGVMYGNRTTKQVTISHRGTDNWRTFVEDIYSIVFGGEGIGQKRDAHLLIRKGLQFLDHNKDYHRLSFTGHSWGGFLAEVSLLFAHNNLSVRKEADTSISFNAVTFESPGCFSSWEALQSNVQSCRVDPDKEDILGYMSYPNLINTYDKQIGTIYYIQPTVTKWKVTWPFTWKVPYWPFTWKFTWPFTYTRECHSMDNIVSWFEAGDSQPLLMLDWPLGMQYKKFDKNVEFKNGKFVFPKSDDSQEVDENNSREQYLKSFDAHLMSSEEMSPPSTIPLRHFSRALQGEIKKFMEVKDPNLDKFPEDIRGYLKELDLPIISGRNSLELVRLKSGDVREFRRVISKWLANNQLRFDNLNALDPRCQFQHKISFFAEGCILAETATATLQNNLAAQRRVQLPEGSSAQDLDNVARFIPSTSNSAVSNNSGDVAFFRNTRLEGNLTANGNAALGTEIIFTPREP